MPLSVNNISCYILIGTHRESGNLRQVLQSVDVYSLDTLNEMLANPKNMAELAAFTDIYAIPARVVF
jgi:hypothetical protein